MRSVVSVRRALALILVLPLVLVGGCSSPSSDATDKTNRVSLEISDAWVKATDEKMSAAFASIENDTDSDITIVSVSSPVSDDVQLHETVTHADHSSAMQEVKAGFTIKADHELELEPGGNHIMLMNLTKPLLPGEDVTFTLTFKDGTTQDFTARVKEFSGANESYDHGEKKH